jgi:hypothetical protein
MKEKDLLDCQVQLMREECGHFSPYILKVLSVLSVFLTKKTTICRKKGKKIIEHHGKHHFASNGG